MVISINIQELYNVSSKAGAVNLPAYKQTDVNICFKEDQINEAVWSKPPLLPFAASDVFGANILAWRRLTEDSSDCKAVYEVSFDVKGSNLKLSPGDTIGVIPQNVTSEVEDIINHLNLQSYADQTYELILEGKVKLPAFVPIKSSLRYVLTHCLDLRSVVKKLFLLALSKHTKEETEKQILEYLCSKEGSSMYNSFVLDKKISILDILQIFKSCKPPVEVLLMNLPRLLPRPYSIVNSPKNSENTLKICFSVMQLETNRKGLTTGFLQDLILNNNLEDAMNNMSISDTNVSMKKKVKIYLRSNMTGFRLPEDKENLILIGPGTGVAPFIGFLEELKWRKDNNIETGKTWLFFGCRNPKMDFLYEKELKGFVEEGVLSKLETAFSRIENRGIKYVQDAITSNGEEIVKFIEDQAIIYVCGDLKTMATAVRDALKSCLEKHTGRSTEDSEIFIANMESSKRYIIDIWS